MSELDSTIERWVAAGLVDRATAGRLRAFEAANPSPPVQPPTPAPGSLALVGEVVGYLGAVLAVSAVAFMVRQTWADLSTPGKLGLVGVLLVVVTAAAIASARVARAPAQRLASVLFLAAVALSGWFTWVVVHNAAGAGDRAVSVWVTGVLATVAAVIYWFRRRALPQVVLLASLIALIIATLESLVLESPSLWEGIAIATLGALWVTLAAGRRLVPDRVGLVIGGLATVLGLQSTAFDNSRTWVLAVGLAASMAMLATSIVRRGESALIVPGAVGLLLMVPQLIDQLFSDSVATWLAVLVTGIALVLLAVRMVRERAREPATVGTDA